MEDLWNQARESIDGNLQGFRELVEQEESIVRFKGEEGNTLLHIVAYYDANCDGENNFRQYIEYLLGKSADINALNDTGRTPLNFYLSYYTTFNAIILLEHGAKVNSINIKELVSLLSLVSSLLKRTEYEFIPHKKINLLHGTLDAYDKYLTKNPDALSDQNEMTQYIQKYKAEIDQYISLDYSISVSLSSMQEYVNPDSSSLVEQLGGLAIAEDQDATVSDSIHPV